jgi:hypothetical protein
MDAQSLRWRIAPGGTWSWIICIVSASSFERRYRSAPVLGSASVSFITSVPTYQDMSGIEVAGLVLGAFLIAIY